jgi:hypothetical protein
MYHRVAPHIQLSFHRKSSGRFLVASEAGEHRFETSTKGDTNRGIAFS